MVSVNFILI